jgi:site-specific recombinase XerD
MEYLQNFKTYLLALKPLPSKVTVKNYVLDVKHFLVWFEQRKQQVFDPSKITLADIQQFKLEKNPQLAMRSLERHLSSLRKFFQCMKLQGTIGASPFEASTSSAAMHTTDPYHLREFKDFLYVYNASNLTIKNYVIDIKQFFTWAQAVLGITEEDILPMLDTAFITEYRDRLASENVFSAASINRKLSSLRKYVAWAKSQNLLGNQNGLQVNPNTIANIPSASLASLPKAKQRKAESGKREELENQNQPNLNVLPLTLNAYSKFPPLRLAQKIAKGINFALEGIFIAPLAMLFVKAQKIAWNLQGQPLFVATKKMTNIQFPISNTKPFVQAVKNLPKALYNPLGISTKDFSWYKKLFHHARYTRPNWYKRYHSYAIAHYFNWAILIIITTAIGFGFYNSFAQKPNSGQPVLAATAPPRILSFQGRLTDASNNAITSSTHLRFGIYTDAASTGSALLWQEVDSVTPDANGVFSVLLGKNSPIQQALFANNQNLFLGITVEQTPELTPRQQLATVAYATNAETLQGLPPITQSGAGTNNVVLALNSSGNLSIGAASTFQTVGGAFTLAGDTLILNTNTGTNGNITLAPDGKGFIDLQKPLINSTNNNNIPSAAGSVEVDDTFAVLATSDAVPAVTINQNGAGTLFTASVGGVSKFTIGNSGSITASSYNTAGGIFYADATGLLLQTTAGVLGQCLVSNGGTAPGWNSCSGTSTSYWTVANGALFPVNTTLDVLFGGTASSGANFAFINNAPGSGTPTASISGNLTLNSAGVIQTTNNQPLTLGGNTTGGIILKPNNGTGTVTFSGYATGIIHSTAGVLSSSAVSLTSDVTGILPLANGGTNNNLTADNGGIVYSDASKLQILAHAGSAGLCLLSGGVGTPSWGACSSAGNFWNINNGALFPINDTPDFLLGGSGATTSAKFAVLNLASGTPVASVSSGLNGFATYVSANGTIQTTRNQGLTIGGNTTGNITLSPLNGTGFITINGTINSNLIPTLTDTYNLGSATNEWNTIFVKNIISGGNYAGFWQRFAGVLSPSNITDDLSVGGSSTSTAKFQVFGNSGNATTAGNLTFTNGGSQIQTTSNQVLTLGGNTTGGITLSPNNGNGIVTVNGIAIQTTASTFNAFTTTATTLGLGVTGGTTTVNSGLTVTGNFTPNGQLAASLIPTSTAINLGSPSNYYGSAYITNLFASATSQYQGFFQRNAGVLAPTNVTDDIAVGSTATSGAKFQIFGNTGNATTAGNLTFNGSGNLIQTTNNNGLIIGGNTTGNITLSPLNGTGTVTVSGLGTGVVHATAGTLSTTFVNLTSEVTGILPIANGGTNTNTIGAAGSLAYSNGSNYAFTAVGSTGQCLVSNGSGSPIWTSCTSAAGATNYWTLDGGNGILYPVNTTLDVVFGGTSSTSANFAFLNNAPGSGTPTASISGNLTLNSAGVIQTTNNQPLTLGGNTTGGIILKPSNGNGSVSFNAPTISTNQTTFNLLNTTATTINFAGAATSISIGNASGTTTVNSGLTVTGTSTLNGNVVLGANNTKTITANGEFNADLIPSVTNTYNLGSAALSWNNLYVNNIISTGSYSGFWQRFLGALSPINIADDLLVGGTSTSTAKFQIFGNTGNATTAGNLTFNGNGLIQTTNNTPLTLGGSSTGNIVLSPNNGTGAITINGFFNSSLLPQTTNTYDLGSSALQWNNVYGNNIYSNGTLLTQLFQKNGNVISPFNISDDLAIGGTSTSTAKFQIFGTTGNATTAGTLTFNTAGSIQTTNNQGLTLGGNTTGNITLSPQNGSGFVTINGTINSNLVPTLNNTYNLGSPTNQWNTLYVNNIISGGNYSGFWQRFLGVVSPSNITDDLAIGGTATSSAKFQVFGNTGNATTTGNLTFTNGGSQIQTTSNQVLTLGGNTTGGITLSPNNGSGNVTVNGVGLNTTAASFNLLNTTATTVNFAGAATVLSVGANSGTTTVNNALTATGTLTGNGSVVLGANNTKTITANGEFNSSLIPSATDTYDLGTSALEWNNLYVKNIISGGNYAGFWQRFLGVVSPTNITDDLSIGGTTTSTPKIHV